MGENELSPEQKFILDVLEDTFAVAEVLEETKESAVQLVLQATVERPRMIAREADRAWLIDINIDPSSVL